MNEDLSRFVSADFLLDELLGDTYDDGGVLREKYARWLFRVWADINVDLIRTTRRKIIPISAPTRTGQLPPDFHDWAVMGWVDECYNLRPLSYNPNLAPRMGIEDERIKKCPVCGSPDLCATLNVEEIYEVMNQGPTKKARHITRLLKSDGSYIEEVEEPTADFSGSAEGTFVNVKHTRTVCQLQPSQCSGGCVPATAQNLAMLASNCCLLGMRCCSQDGLAYATNNSFPGSFNIFKNEGFIQFSPDTQLNSFYLEYVSTGLCRGADEFFPLTAMNTLIDGAYLLSISKKRGISVTDKVFAERQYTRNLKKLLRRLTPVNFQFILECFEQAPRIPAT